jgi:hypothetical protein
MTSSDPQMTPRFNTVPSFSAGFDQTIAQFVVEIYLHATGPPAQTNSVKSDECALKLQKMGLFRAAESFVAQGLAAAESRGRAEDMVLAHTRRASIALDCGRPQTALRWGTQVLPLALGSRPASPEARARLFGHLAMAAWELGLEGDLSAYVDAARSVVDHEPVSPQTEVHIRVAQGLAAYAQADVAGATAHTLQALELAGRIGDAGMARRCRLNLSFFAVRSGAFEDAEAHVRTILDSGAPDPDLVEALGDGVSTALAFGDLRLAGVRLRRLLDAYLTSPSRLSPVALGYLFEAIGSYYARRGLAEAAAALWVRAAAWFARRGRDREVEVLRRRAAEVRAGPLAVEEATIDPDLVYLGRLFAAAWLDESQDGDFQVALAVNRLLPAIAPAAEPVATEHAAMLRPFEPVARLFAARSAAGRAAVRVLTGEDEPARAALDVLAAYERLCAAGLGWPTVIRSMKSARLAAGPVHALDRLYQELIA